MADEVKKTQQAETTKKQEIDDKDLEKAAGGTGLGHNPTP
jgi:hypothetical protein